MDLAYLAAAILVISSPGETVLLDFRADYCGPCVRMDPVVSQLEAEGFPVRKVNVDEPRNQALASRFGIREIPCFVMLVDGKEVDREARATDRQRLLEMLGKSGVGPAANSIRGQSPEPSRQPLQPVPFPAGGSNGSLANNASSHFNDSPRGELQRPASLQPLPPTSAGQYDHLIRASARLRIEDDKDAASRGSGTVIDAREGEALILTCGHVFRDAAKNGWITVDLFGPGAPQGLPGRLVAFDLKSDVGLLSVETNYPVAVAHLAPAEFKLKRGDRVVSVGCDGGADATARETQVTSINRYTEPAANIQVAFQPVQGRSGGGLFTPEGWVVGVCNAADPQDNEGLFAGLPVVQEELDKLGLSFIYRDMPTGQHAVADGRLQAGVRNQESGVRGQETVSPPRAEANGPLAPAEAFAGGPPANSGQLSAEERAALEMLHAKSREAEVVCIIRPRGNPDAKSEIIVLDQVSANFAKQLASGREPRGPQRLTSLESPTAVRGNQPPAQSSRPAAPNSSRPSEAQPFKLRPWWAESLER